MNTAWTPLSVSQSSTSILADSLTKMTSLLFQECGKILVHYFGLPACIFLLLAAFFKGMYNRYLHPLPGIPGPFWGSVTKLYLVYMISSVPIKGLQSHQRYGEPCFPDD